jgi:hypothetical protein
MYSRLLLIFLLALILCTQAKAQQQKAVHDSIKIIQDSVRYKEVERDSKKTVQDSSQYIAIQKFSQKSKFTRFIHRLFFKPVGPRPISQPKNAKIKNPVTNASSEGKVIRKILITTLDPFGYSISDTSIHPQIFLMKAGNSLHVKTRNKIIKNLLLFKENERWDSLLIRESERLIRSQTYVHDVQISTTHVSGNSDSVDVYIRELDVWSIVPAGGLSSSSISMGLTDINLAGLGNGFQGRTQWNRPSGDNVSRLSYLIPNIRNTYISLNLQYLFSPNSVLINNSQFTKFFYSPTSSGQQYLFSGNTNIIKSIEIARAFYSPLTKWAGGIFLGQMMTTQSYIREDTIRYLSSLTNIQDYWLARSWQIRKLNTGDGRITSLILSGRFLEIRSAKSPVAIAENIFNKENFYFTGIGIASRKYFRDKYIFNYGKVEDVPVGRTFGITVGIDAQQTNRLYLGFNAGWGNYYRFGYLSTHLEYGVYKGSAGYQQGVFTARINYYTRLLNLGNWKLRQFVRPALVLGINRLPTDNLIFSEGLKGFEPLGYSGTNLMVLTLQTQSYAPWNLLGFHFGPYLFTSLGMLGNQSSGFKNSQLYSLIGFGLLIKNDYLTFNTFQISFTFYPFIPGKGYDILRMNSYKTSDYGFRDFEISKPGVVDFR